MNFRRPRILIPSSRLEYFRENEKSSSVQLYKKKKKPVTLAKNQKDGSIVESDRSYLGYASNERKNMEKRKEGRKEDTVAENDGIHLLTATELTCSSRGKTQAARGQPETDDGLFG